MPRVRRSDLEGGLEAGVGDNDPRRLLDRSPSRIIAVTAPAGSGKSRMVSEWLRSTEPGSGAEPEPGAGPITLAPMSNFEMRQTKPHDFSQGWGLVGPKQRITVGGYPVQIAGTADGKTIYLAQAPVKGSVVPTIGSAPYEAIRADLQRAGIRILRQRKINIISGISQLILETNGNAYGTLTR